MRRMEEAVMHAAGPFAANSHDALLSLDGASVRFGRVVALSDIDLQVSRHERVALIGANGSGKSTLLRLMHGLVPAAQGRRERMPGVTQAMVFQRPFMLRTSARNNVALGLWLRGVRWRDAAARAGDALARVGLADQAARHAPSLSGGQQQRLALARAWSVSPQLLFLDEPTASLDPHAKREVEAVIAEFAVAGMTLVFASHNLGQVKRLATRVIYIEHGRVLADLPVNRFFDRAYLPTVSPQADLFVKGETA